MAAGDIEAEVRTALRVGVELFNQGHFWECHEVLEGVWHRDANPRRRFLQGLIKVAAGYHHLVKGNYTGMDHLLTAGRELLLPFGPKYMGVELGGLLRATAQHAEWARRARTSRAGLRPPEPPILNLRPEPMPSEKRAEAAG